MDSTLDNIEKYHSLFDMLKHHKWDDFLKNLENLDMTFDINIRDSQHNYFLTYAIIFNKYDIVNVLVQRGARIDITDQEDRSILYVPIKYSYVDILRLLLESNKDNIGVSIIDVKDKNMRIPLHYAISLKSNNTVELLLKFGSNPNTVDKSGYNSLHIAVYSRVSEICRYIIKYISSVNARCSTGETALHIACNLQLIDIARLLLDHSINTNLQDYSHEVTALHYSVHLNNKELVALLLKHGAMPNIQDVAGNTALHYAVLDNDFEIFLMLTQSIHTKNIINMNLWNMDGQIPLHIVLKNNSDNLSDYLDRMIDKSNLSIQDNEGNTCLHYLIALNIWKEHISSLIKKRLDIFAQNIRGDRPIDMIPKEDYNDFIDVVVGSYYYRLKKAGYLWDKEWENICSKMLTDVTEDELKTINLKKVTEPDFEKTCKNIIKDKIRKLINDVMSGTKLTCTNKSFPQKKEKLCIQIDEGTSLNYCTFTGTTLDTLIGLIYLLKKHSNACSTLTTRFAENKDLCKFYKSIGIIMNSKCEFLNFEIIWAQQKLYLIEGFYEQIKKCTKNKRFVIIPLGIDMREGNHANYIIYDNLKKEVERFEPHGATTPPGLHYNPNLLDEILEARFKIIDENIKYVRPSEYLPKIGFQTIDVFERNKKKIGDPEGFCALWSIWYVDNRLMQKDVDRKELVDTLIRTVKLQNISFKNMIRNYGKNIINIRDKILKKSKMDINDWLNDQYTDIQINSIMSELTAEIENIII